MDHMYNDLAVFLNNCNDKDVKGVEYAKKICHEEKNVSEDFQKNIRSDP